MKRVVDADFYSSCTRKPSVYRGNPFLIEAALAYVSADSGSVEPPAPVPEPATILLMGVGLLGMVGYNRKRFRKKN